MESPTAVKEEYVFKNAPNPYGYPIIGFPSSEGDSTIFMTAGHHPPTRRLVATFNWILRHYGVIFLVERSPESFMEWGFASYSELPSEDEKVENFKIDLSKVGSSLDSPVTYFEA